MSSFVDYYRIVTPPSRKSVYAQPATVTLDDGMNLNSSGYASFATVAWFSNMLKGSTARLQRYKQYDAMDTADIHRALDIIAEEISSPDKRTGLPFIIDYQTEENQTIPTSVATTLRAALRHWANLHGLHKRVFNVARTLCKYGDCFFRKRSDTKKWEYVDPTRVMGIEITAEQEVLNYFIRPSSFTNTITHNGGGQNEFGERVPAAAIIHFTLSDDMGDTAPFGLSILQPAFKDYQKLSMLEDSAVIYRIVRAPERRVYYIDVGNMPPVRVKQYLQQIRDDIRQKRIPNTANSNTADSQYNPESISEDLFFPVTSSGRGSRVETLPGGTTWDLPELDHFMNKVFRALRVPSSYMRGQDANPPGAQFNDGKVGVAFQEERIFSNFIIRLQACVEDIFDGEFKTYLQTTGINIDPDMFKLKLVEPQNFALYRQAAIDTELVSTFNAIGDDNTFSKRFIMKRYLGLTEDEIQMNETLRIQELGIKEGLSVDVLQQLYNPNFDADKIKLGKDEVSVEEPEGDVDLEVEPE